ncbi:MAG TPA: cytochrome c oxidase accessory protein CcoG, partial [Telluria sp.]
LDRQPWTADKIARRGSKHLAWGLVALWTGFTFVGYFAPVRTLGHAAATLALGPWQAFWIAFYALATYGNAGWLREQVCKYMCPYARFQSAMFDKDTLIVTYDRARGEPRGPQAGAQREGKGDCIDCSMCVQVCPTGIDIRKGLQYECIGCAACVDACNSVMDKIDLPRGLIRYSTDRALDQKWSARQIARRVARPRVLIYTSLLAVIVIGFLFSLYARTPLKLDVIRDRGSMGREVGDGMIENVYRLQIMNTAETAHRFTIQVAGIDGITLADGGVADLDAASTRAVPVRVQAARGAAHKGSNEIRFILTAEDDPSLHVTEKAVFIVPR